MQERKASIRHQGATVFSFLSQQDNAGQKRGTDKAQKFQVLWKFISGRF
jgi:hypothetical protein